jgi:hypothetical protein
LLAKSRRCAMIASLVFLLDMHIAQEISTPHAQSCLISRAWGRAAARAATLKAELDKESYEVFSRKGRSENSEIPFFI